MAWQLGLNARAALITRGLAEMTRLGVALGAQRRHLHGPVGLGDLVLTATGDLSRNRQVGLLLAQGMTLAAGGGFFGPCGRGRVQRPHRGAARASLGVEMPISRRRGGAAGWPVAAR